MPTIREIAELPAWFRQTKAGREIVDEAQSEVHDRRKHAAECLKLAETEARDTLPPLAKQTAAARENLQSAKRAVAEAQRALATVEVAELTAANRVSADIAKHQAFLHDTAPQVVADYLAELLQFYADVRRAHIVQHDPGLPNLHGADIGLIERQMKQLNARWNHSQNAKQFMELVFDTITLVKRMLVEPITEQEAAKRIAVHRASITKAQTRAGVTLN